MSHDREIVYKHDPGPQLTAGQIKAALADVPDETPAIIAFGIDFPHAKAEDYQPAIEAVVEEVRSDTFQPAVTTLVIRADYPKGEYSRTTREGDFDYDQGV